MKFAAALLLSTIAIGCSHAKPKVPPAFGYHGLIRPHRDIACVLDDEMDAHMCDVVAQAAEKINSAVGYELLSVPRHTTLVESRAAKPDSEIIYVGVTALQPGILGVTYPVMYEKETGFIRLEVIVFDPQIWKDPAMAAAVTLHELMHSVGAEHSSQLGPWDSCIKPQWKPGAPIELTPGDLAALRIAYAQ